MRVFKKYKKGVDKAIYIVYNINIKITLTLI